MIFKTKIFKKLFFTYSLIIFVSFLILAIFVTGRMENNIKEQEFYINRKIIIDANDYINNQIYSTKFLFNRLYERDEELYDTISYLDTNFEKYLEFQLNKFSSSNKSTYSDVQKFVEEIYGYNNNIEDIYVYSYKKNELTRFDENRGIITSSIDKVNLTNIENRVLNTIDKENKENFFSISYIKNPETFNEKGFFIATYKMDEFDNILEKYNALDNRLMLLTSAGYVIYDSSKKYEGELYPYFENIINNKKNVIIDDKAYIDFVLNSEDMVVVSTIPKEVMFQKIKITLITTYITAIVIMFCCEIILYFKISKLGNRTNDIIYAIDTLKEGEFNISIPIGSEEDELQLIAKSFNNMCVTLDGYIKKVYLAEIKQKKAELNALQTQINPHFLYNTLESIRMKAIVNEDREVGKMLYNLAALFRNMIKGENIITIEQEFRNCEMYLELYKFRYDDKFEYCIDIDSEILNNKILKFIIQPIIENSLVHGIDLGKQNNFLMITVEKRKENIFILVQDNGKGISEERICEINNNLQRGSKVGESIGLYNVHERIVLYYGVEYGIKLMNGKANGMEVEIKIPAIREANNE